MKTPREVLENLCLPCKKDPFIELIRQDIDQALASLREVVLGKKKEIKWHGFGGDEPSFNDLNHAIYELLIRQGYNQAIQDIADLFR